MRDHERAFKVCVRAWVGELVSDQDLTLGGTLMTPSPLQCPRLNYFAPQADRAFAAAGGRPRNPWTPDEEAQAIHDDLVGENQIHKCAVAANGCKKTPDGPCKRHFDRFVVTQITSFDKKCPCIRTRDMK